MIYNPFTRRKYKKGYINMFEKMFPSLIRMLDPNHDYWPASPSNGGFLKGKTGILASNDPSRGDSHYWMVWHGGRPFSAYRNFDSRFMSEFGFESFPSIKTLSQICPKDQYGFYTPIMKNHQKNSAGNKKIMNYMKKRFSIPKDFLQQIIISQITQAEAMEYGVEHWRRNRNDFHCMGSLYWQLNDCWQVASWSSLDYYGRWKALQYYAKRFYQKIFASVVESKETVELWATNDSLTPFHGLFQWKIFHSSGKELMCGSEECEIAPCCSNKIKIINVRSINKIKLSRRNHIIFYALMDKENKELISRGFRLFENPKTFCLKDPKLNFNIIAIKDDLIEVELSAERIALYVFIDSTELDFIASDNFFSLIPNEKVKIFLKAYIPWNEADKEKYLFSKYSNSELKSKIQIKSLFELIK
jgi:beta-mannosidase